jgi:hypothetical protein
MTIARVAVSRRSPDWVRPQRTESGLSGSRAFPYPTRVIPQRAIKMRSRRWWWYFSQSSDRSLPILACPLPWPSSKLFRVAHALAEAGVESLLQVDRAQPAAHYGRPTAQKLVALAKQSARSGRAEAGRAVSLRILCDQLEHTRANLARLDSEIEHLLNTDPGVKGLQQVPRVWLEDARSPARRVGGCAAFCAHRRSDRLWRHG